MPLISPMILAKFHNSSVILGIVQSSFGAAGVVGGLLMTIWGGTKKKVYSLFIGIVISSLGMVLLGVVHTVLLVVVAVVVIGLTNVVINASSQAIWQSIVPLEIQGRVFAARRFIAQFVSIIPMALSGPFVDFYLADKINSSPALSTIFGAGKGGAIAFLASLSGAIIVIIGIVAILLLSISAGTSFAQSNQNKWGYKLNINLQKEVQPYLKVVTDVLVAHYNEINKTYQIKSYNEDLNGEIRLVGAMERNGNVVNYNTADSTNANLSFYFN
jgi:MFS family permease